ncbi:MAG: DMT family transporter [Alphaproteobacteria bacterium]|nr:DMT family transporter [Alphaproteobacteria bacterium]MBU4543545.1 DMT family transporter [Alphaproteobacteria bacterium]MBU4549170.1 DMT family transporter [Alphaproteobacteria bacterium]
MIAFAANSVLGRMATGPGDTPLIDPASYSAVRLVSGALMLWVLVAVTGNSGRGKAIARSGSWGSAFALFAYAVAFSYAYVALDTGTGALILFACVQATMIGWGLKEGDRPSVLEWLGLLTAFGAFVWLVSPGLAAPDPVAAAAMALSGVAWGAYSLRGRNLADPLKATADNFLRSSAFVAPLAIIVLAAQLPVHASLRGLALATLSGAVTSGLGYALWYRVLRQTGAAQAAIVQLTVPVIAAIGGVLLLDENWTLRLILSSLLILGGVAVAILAKQRRV